MEKDRERLFAPYAVGRPAHWACDSRTKDLICLVYYLREQLPQICASENDRRDQENYFNRRATREDDLFELAARVLNMVLDDEIYRRRHRRWGI